MSRKAFVSWLYEHNYMISPDLFSSIPEDFDFNNFYEEKGKSLEKQDNLLILDQYLLNNLLKKEEKKIKDLDVKTNVEMVNDFSVFSGKKEVKHFVSYFKKRYEKIKSILMSRNELQNSISLNRVSRKSESEKVSVIGVVLEISETKNGNFILTLEDTTGMAKVLIHKNNKVVSELLQELVLDEVIGIIGVMGKDIIFADNLYFPDLPIREFKKCNDDVNVVFTADLHIGSNKFVEGDLIRFIDWLNLNYGSEEDKDLAKKVKYLFIAGDLVDGVGVYPEQDKELIIKDIVKQYEKCAELLGKIRKDISIIICGGNHDALRISEPQPFLNKDFARKLYELNNVFMVTNPSLINIHKINGFQGFNILMYHGYSFDYYVNNVSFLRNNGGYDRADNIMEFLLRKRHLAPTHSSTLYMPHIDSDPLVIETIPDFFISGHIHHDVTIRNYKNITLIGCGSWQSMTVFQEKMGHTNIVPSKVSVVSLKTRTVKLLDFREIKI